MSIEKCLEQIQNERPRKRISAESLDRRVALFMKVVYDPVKDPTEQYSRLKKAFLCGKLT